MEKMEKTNKKAFEAELAKLDPEIKKLALTCPGKDPIKLGWMMAFNYLTKTLKGEE